MIFKLHNTDIEVEADNINEATRKVAIEMGAAGKMELDSIQHSHTAMDGDFRSSKVFFKTGLGELTTRDIQLTAQHAPPPKQPAPTFVSGSSKFKCNHTGQIVSAPDIETATKMFTTILSERNGKAVTSTEQREATITSLPKYKNVLSMNTVTFEDSSELILNVKAVE